MLVAKNYIVMQVLPGPATSGPFITHEGGKAAIAASVIGVLGIPLNVLPSVSGLSKTNVIIVPAQSPACFVCHAQGGKGEEGEPWYVSVCDAHGVPVTR